MKVSDNSTSAKVAAFTDTDILRASNMVENVIQGEKTKSPSDQGSNEGQTNSSGSVIEGHENGGKMINVHGYICLNDNCVHRIYCYLTIIKTFVIMYLAIKKDNFDGDIESTASVSESKGVERNVDDDGKGKDRLPYQVPLHWVV